MELSMPNSIKNSMTNSLATSPRFGNSVTTSTKGEPVETPWYEKNAQFT